MSNFGMNTIGKIHGRRPLDQLFDLPFGGKDIDNIGKKIHLERIHKLSIISQLMLPFHQLAEPGENLIVFRINFTFLFIFPMGGNTFLSNLMHFLGSNLKLYPLSHGTTDRRMEGLIAVGLGDPDIVFKPTRHRTP